MTSSEKYWEDREKELYKLYEKESNTVVKDLKKAYLKSFTDIKTEIKAYKYDHGSYEETAANNLLAKIEAILKSLFELEENTLSTNIMTFYETNKARVGKFLQDAGITDLVVETVDAFGNVVKETRNMLTYAVHNVQAVENVLKEKFLGHNFSSRIWNNKAKLSFTLKSSLTEGLIRGESYAKIANRINKQMGTSFYNCERLARTELKRAVDKSKLDKYAEAGITQYKLRTAHDNRVCEKCKPLDGKIFNISDAKPGVNYLLHPNCREVIIPVVDLTV